MKICVCRQSWLKNIIFSAHLKSSFKESWVILAMSHPFEQCQKDTDQWRIQVVWETGIPVGAPKLWRPKNTFKFFFHLHFNKKHVEVVINDLAVHLIILKWLRRQKHTQKKKSWKQQQVQGKEETVNKIVFIHFNT